MPVLVQIMDWRQTGAKPLFEPMVVSLLPHICVTRHQWVNASVMTLKTVVDTSKHDDVIKWKHFPRYWPFVRGIHRSPVNSPHKGQWRGALIFSLICARINCWVNNREAGDLRRHQAHCDVIVMHGPTRNRNHKTTQQNKVRQNRVRNSWDILYIH